MINKRFLDKYDYRISRDKVSKLLQILNNDWNQVQLQLKLNEKDWEDFIFVLRTHTEFFVKKSKVKGQKVETKLIQLNSKTLFELVDEVNPINHPHVNEKISKGIILNYSEKPAYGVVNRYKGLPLELNGYFYQINYDYIKLIDSGIQN